MRPNATRMAEERIQALAATTPAASALTAPYAHHQAKEPQVIATDPPRPRKKQMRKMASIHMAELNSVHITRPESARAGLSY